MVFVTVGTHEQPFDRLMREVERLVATGELFDVVVQYGYSTIVPKGCHCERLLPYAEMNRLFFEADVVVTHGGPSTFIEAISAGRMPVVMPRRAEFGEHINDHQVEFVRQYAERVGGIVPAYEVSDLADAVKKARAASANAAISSNSARFCEELRRLIAAPNHESLRG